ncbi:GH32 C-terminal domain-containing protein [Microbacterium sp.]|uniref:GH32 C-terminal domain-containing protein n=1 Tax=Microbacterium sp. TaxID=51671 RepID=UPI001AD2CA7E|nr:GH32 C-terminal domain-containing protein [Microbacterium sp.]MBN9158365.1 GH32 C-terminal domain-containing protein [Microbacterium sp.]MBS1896935.1 GH32 C-terminal domain-containing protein [Actinomycetota bacterium]
MTDTVFFHPDGGWVGDVIPFARDGVFHLWYLFDDRKTPKTGMPWHLVTTTDFVHFEDHGVAVPSGGPDAEDFNVYTGSVVVGDDDVAHLFSTASNPWRLGEDGRPLQLVAHATSTAGLTGWVKHPELTFGAPEGYETGDWRDPFVFRDGDLWRMLVAARHAEGPSRRRGTIAQLTSTDLRTWTPVAPFWDPRRYIAHECPDVFRWGDWWYLVYSEFSDAFCTRYRMARSLDGPWLVPDDDTVDARSFYAAKTVEHDGRRFFVGWIATREGDTDDGAWQWAGTLSTLEATQRADGTLSFRLPDEFLASFSVPVAPGAIPAPVHLDATDGFAQAIGDAELPDSYLLTAELDIAEGTEEVGLLVRSTADGDEAGAIRLEPRRDRVVFDRWPRTTTGGEQWQISGDVPFVFERPCPLPAGRHRVEIVVSDDILVAVVDRRVALSTRLYRRAGGHVGVFVNGGAAELLSLEIRTRP